MERRAVLDRFTQVARRREENGHPVVLVRRAPRIAILDGVLRREIVRRVGADGAGRHSRRVEHRRRLRDRSGHEQQMVVGRGPFLFGVGLVFVPGRGHRFDHFCADDGGEQNAALLEPAQVEGPSVGVAPDDVCDPLGGNDERVGADLDVNGPVDLVVDARVDDDIEAVLRVNEVRLHVELEVPGNTSGGVRASAAPRRCAGTRAGAV